MKIQIKNADKLKKEDYCRILLLSVRLLFIRLGASSLQKNGKKNDIVHLSNYPHPPGLIVTAERMTNHIN